MTPKKDEARTALVLLGHHGFARDMALVAARFGMVWGCWESHITKEGCNTVWSVLKKVATV